MSEYCACATSFDGSCQLHDRIDALTAENAALLAERALIVARAENAEAALAYAVSTGDECAIEVEALRKDAERYRWLRGSESVPAHSIRWARWEIRHWQGTNGWLDLLRSELDVAIDAAMEQSHE